MYFGLNRRQKNQDFDFIMCFRFLITEYVNKQIIAKKK